MFKRAIVIAVAVLAMLGLAATPAQAAWYCPAEHVCFYWLQGGLGYRYDFGPITLGSNPYLDIYVGEPVRSSSNSVTNGKVNTYISRIYYTAGCNAIWGYYDVNIHRGQGHNIQGNAVTCFRIGWV